MKKRFFDKNFLAVFFSLYLVLSSYSIYMILFPISSYVQIATLGICSAIFLFYYTSHPIKIRVLVEPIIVISVLILISLINGSDIKGVFLLGLRLILIYYAVSIFILQGYDMMYSLYKAIFILAVIFLAFHIVFDYIIPQAGLAEYYTYSTDPAGITKEHVYSGHYKIYFRWNTATEVFGLKLLRCSGFCWESGQYQIYLNYALMYLLFFDGGREKHKMLKTIILIIGIITTTSTMGYIIALILLSGVVLNIRSRIKFFIQIIMAVFVVWLIYRLIIEKQEIATISYTSRTSEFDYLKDIFFVNDPFGKGFGTGRIVNGILRFMWEFGYISVGIIFLLVYYIFTNNAFFTQTKMKVFFLIWLVLSLFNEPIQYMNCTFAIFSMISLGFVMRKDINVTKKQDASTLENNYMSDCPR